MNKICCLIPARYGSSRLNGKPLLKINNKTVIQRTYEQTLKSKYLDNNNVYITTDDDRIIDHIKTFGGKYIKVTEECLNGTERICHALKQMNNEYDIILNVQGDEPFIDPDNIDLCISKYLEKDDNNVVCTTIHFNIKESYMLNDRGIGKLITDKYDNIIYCSRALIPHTKSGNPDSNFTYNGHIGIFVFDSNYLNEYLQHPNTPCQLSEDIEWLKIIEMGYKIRSYCVKESEIGINTPEDYQYLLDKYQN